MSLAPLSENLHYYLCGEFLALMHFCKLYISVRNFVVPFLSHHHPMKLFSQQQSRDFVTLAGPVLLSVGHCDEPDQQTDLS